MDIGLRHYTYMYGNMANLGNLVFHWTAVEHNWLYVDKFTFVKKIIMMMLIISVWTPFEILKPFFIFINSQCQRFILEHFNFKVFAK